MHCTTWKYLDVFLIVFFFWSDSLCFLGRGEYVVFEPSEKGPKGLVTQVPSKKYAGLYIFQSVYGHLIGDGFVFNWTIELKKIKKARMTFWNSKNQSPVFQGKTNPSRKCDTY